MNKKKKISKNKLIYRTAMAICIIVFVGCAAYLLKYFLDNKKSEEKVDFLRDLIIEDDTDEYATSVDAKEDAPIEFVTIDGVKVQKKYSKLYEKNHDFVGWITIEGTKIDYPVMQTVEDEEYYIKKDFDKNYSDAGSLFVSSYSDLKKPSDNTLIYGHNMKIGTMFHDLLNYEDESFYKNHKYIYFNTIYGNNTYEVIGAFRTKAYNEDYTGFKYYQFYDAETEEEFDEYMDFIDANNEYTIKTKAEFGDKLLTLSTCAYHTENGRYIVIAKKVK